MRLRAALSRRSGVSSVAKGRKQPNLADNIPLDSLRLPTRVENWLEGHRHLTTLGQLVRIDPKALAKFRNIGRTSIASLRELIAAHYAESWEALSRADAAEGAGLRTGGGWNHFRVTLPADIVRVALAEFALPTRMRSLSERQGWTTLGELAANSSAELLAMQNLSRVSLTRTIDAVQKYMRSRDGMRALVAESFIAPWKAILQDVKDVPRMVLTLRAGLSVPPKTLNAIASLLGVTRQRVRQIELAALSVLARERAWLEVVCARINEATKWGIVPLDELARDPWWAEIASLPGAFDYFCVRLLGRSARVVQQSGRPCLRRTARLHRD